MKKIWVGFGIVAVILAIALAVVQTKRQPQEIRIGASLPLTGEVASYGIKAQRGIEIALEEINAAGGIGNKKISVTFEDDRNDPKTAVAIMSKFSAVDKLPVVIGSAGSTVTLAMTPVANKNKVVLMSPVSSSVKLTKEGGQYFFRVCPADDAQAKILSQWVLEKGHQEVALIFTNNSWGKPLAEAFQKYFESGGGKVVVSEAVEEKTTDLRAQLAKVKNADIKIIVSPTYPVEGGSLVKQAKEMGIEAEFYGGDNWDAPEFLTVASNAAEGAFFVDPSEAKGEKYLALAKKYKEKYGEEPDINVAFGYDAMLAAAEAMKRGGSDGPSIRESLFKVSFAGASGIIEFDENGDLKTPTFDRNVIREGKKTRIDGAEE